MKRFVLIAGFLVLTCGVAADFREFESVPRDAAMEAALADVAAKTLDEFAKSGLKEGNLSITLIDLSDSSPRRASFEGRIPYHPASVVKAFYLVSAYEEMRKGHLVLDAPLRAAMRDMIVDSSNDATAYVVDRITGTTGGPELTGRAFRKFVDRRNLPNRYFHALGYDINANGKTWCEAPYGRELQILGKNREYRNRFTSDAFASLMLWLVRERAVSAAASREMLALMKRPLAGERPESPDTQVVEFTGQVLPAGSKLWSKAGWTGEVRHDMAYVELPSGRKFIVAIMTRGAAADIELVPSIARRVLTLMQ